MSTEVEGGKPQTKRIPDLDQDEKMVQSLVLIPEKYMKKLNGLSLVKETSKGAIVREALRKYFHQEDIEKVEVAEVPKGSKVPNGLLNNILKECTTFWGNFEVEGEHGFIALAKEKGIELKDLTDAQFERVAEKLEVGYNGYAFTPSIDEFIGKLSELELSEKQKDILREKLGEEESGEHGGEDEETWGEEEEGEEW